MSNPFQHLKSSIGKKQVVAVTGLCLILFLIGHLLGNLFIYAGPEAFNHYAEKLANLRPGLFLIEAGLAYIFFVHIFFTFLVVIDNYRSRPIRYAVYQSSERRSLATRLMPFTGMIILGFVIWHLLDFTFVDPVVRAARSLIYGRDFGVYGVVFNAFTNPIHSVLYVIAMIAVGFHLSHAIQSVAQTFGCNRFGAGRIKNLSNMVGAVIAIAFSSIPIFILFKCVGNRCLLL